MPQHTVQIELEVDPISGYIRPKTQDVEPREEDFGAITAPEIVLPLRKNLFTKEFNLAGMGEGGLERAWAESMAAGRKAMMLEREYPYCPHCGRQATLQIEVPITDTPEGPTGFTSSWFLPTKYYMKVFVGCPDLEEFYGGKL